MAANIPPTMDQLGRKDEAIPWLKDKSFILHLIFNHAPQTIDQLVTSVDDPVRAAASAVLQIEQESIDATSVSLSAKACDRAIRK